MSEITTLNQYQEKAEEFASYPDKTTIQALTYLGLGISDEAGEVSGKIKKILRGDCQLDANTMVAIAYELGDVLWYISEVARVLDFDLSYIAVLNYHKLSERKKLGLIKGSGDTIEERLNNKKE